MINSQEPFDDKTGARHRTAESLESAADSIRSAEHRGANAINDLAHEAGDKLDSTASRVRGFGARKLGGNLRLAIRRHPFGSLALAATLGVAAGYSCSRSRSAC
jgi:hypothetical protein